MADIDAEIGMGLSKQQDPIRPMGLITVVLRAAVQALLKCCDLTWRELAKGAIYDVCCTSLVGFQSLICRRVKIGKAIRLKSLFLRVHLCITRCLNWKKP